MENILLGISTLVVVFVLVVVLGLQIQISTLARKVDDLVKRIDAKLK